MRLFPATEAKRTIEHMRGLVAATAVLGVLAAGGLPTLGHTPAADGTGPGGDDVTRVRDEGPSGPPPWAMGKAHGRSTTKAKDKAKDKAKGAGEGPKGLKDGRGPRWSQGRPPGLAREKGPGADRTPHGWLMRDWAHCVAGADKPKGQRFDPEAVCGTRPTPPGQRAR